jgi:hypothetical protein
MTVLQQTEKSKVTGFIRGPKSTGQILQSGIFPYDFSSHPESPVRFKIMRQHAKRKTENSLERVK